MSVRTSENHPANAPAPVLISVRELNQGGVERDVTKIAKTIDRSRYTPHVATYYSGGLRYEELRAAEVPILVLPLRSLFSVEAVRCAFKMLRYIRAHRIRIVHAYDASGVFTLPVARLARVPGVIGSQLSYRNILDPKTQKLLRASDHVAGTMLVNCEAMRKYMIEEEHFPADRVELCYNGVETSVFYPQAEPKPHPLEPDCIAVGTVCALRAEKNLGLLQEAFARIVADHPKLRLVIVGSGVERDSLIANAERLGIIGTSVFIPATKDVTTWMRALDIFVLPSYSEAFSNSLLEALACGCAAVGSRVGGTPELIGSNDERGLLFTSNDVNDLADKLRRLVADRELRRTLGSRGAKFAREELSMEIAAQRTAAIYDRVLSRTRS